MNDLVITSLEVISAFDLNVNGGKFLFTLDELKNCSIGQTEEKQELTGKLGRKLSSFKKNKAVTISGTNGMVSTGLLEKQTGTNFENKRTKILWTDYLEVNGNTAKTTYKAVGTTGAEIRELHIKNASDEAAIKFVQNHQVAAGKFTYNPDTQVIAFNQDDKINNGTEIVVIYEREINAAVHENFTDVYSSKCQLYIDAIAEDKCGKVYHVQFYIPKADFNGEFSLDLGDDQTVHAFEAESLAGGCGASDALWTFTVFGADTKDYTGA